MAEATIFERFEATANAYPAEVAYSNGAVSLLYSELASRARAARVRLLSSGPSEPGFVGILTADRVHALAAILGTAGSGHAYVLLDPQDPDRRLGHIIEAVGPFAILADDAALARAEGLVGDRGGRVLNLDDPEPQEAGEQRAGPTPSPDSLLYVSFTSGSTGIPKGVCQTHRNLAFYVDAYIDAMEIRAQDRISWLFAPGASASNMDIYGALFTGGQLCAFDVRNESFPAMAKWIDDQRITLLHTVPTVARELAGAVEKDRIFDSVRTVDLAGEMLFATDVARIRPHFPDHCRIFNRLAATEASFISGLILTGAHEKAEGALPVGTPPSGVEVGIFRADGAEAARGETGAIVIDSPHVCTGYFNRPDLNQAVFSELEGRPGWRRFTSADMGFIDDSGNLNFIGRSGSRIKLRGQAVDLAEVESALHDCPGVTGAVVLPRGQSGEETREIVAYVTQARGFAPDAREIRKQLSLALPVYMLPSGYVFLDSFPSTATSKVDRQALAQLDLAEVRFRPGYVPPEGEVEEQVAAIFSQVLGTPSVGRLDDFFLLGGDSLSLVNLQILATEAFGRQLPELHEDATVKGTAERLRTGQSGGDSDAPILLPVRTKGSSPPLFVVHGRRGLAHVGPRFLQLLGDDQPFYALQARGLDGKQEPHETIDAMAAEYLAAIKTVQPEGPYFLGGFCAGCYVALEMMRMLRRGGERYYPPLLIDPPPPDFKRHPKNPEEVELKRIERRVKAGEWKIDLQNPRAVDAALKVMRAFERALENHTTDIFPVRSMIIGTTHRWLKAEYVRMVFGQKAHVFLIDGGHREMLSPDNRPFAQSLRKCIGHVGAIAREHRARMSGKTEPAREHAARSDAV